MCTYRCARVAPYLTSVDRIRCSETSSCQTSINFAVVGIKSKILYWVRLSALKLKATKVQTNLFSTLFQIAEKWHFIDSGNSSIHLRAVYKRHRFWWGSPSTVLLCYTLYRYQRQNNIVDCGWITFDMILLPHLNNTWIIFTTGIILLTTVKRWSCSLL